MRFFLAFAFSLLLLAGVTHAEERRQPIPFSPDLHFRPIKDPVLLKFAVSYFRELDTEFDKRSTTFKGKRGFRFLRDHVRFSENDINDDGVPELFLALADAAYCGTAGCTAAIFRKTPTGYEIICGTSFDPDYTGGGEISAEKEHGYHAIRAPEAIIHWEERQEPNSGGLCRHEDLTQ
jgi:hypothetical protein